MLDGRPDRVDVVGLEVILGLVVVVVPVDLGGGAVVLQVCGPGRAVVGEGRRWVLRSMVAPCAGLDGGAVEGGAGADAAAVVVSVDALRQASLGLVVGVGCFC